MLCAILTTKKFLATLSVSHIFLNFNPECVDTTGKDQDRDGINDGCDNCIFYRNPNQENSDNDVDGDVCDPDDDNDGKCKLPMGSGNFYASFTLIF